MRKSLILVPVLFLLICGCGSKATTKRVGNPVDLYVQGMDFMKVKKYDKAIERFSTIRENFPFDPISLVATVKLGDAHFARKEYIIAAGVYEDFFQAYPEDENIAYVLSRLGDCYSRQVTSIDRDQAVIIKAIERLTFLKNRYPNSPEAKGVDVRIAELNQRLADRELYVGEFYYRTGRYNAAILRLEYLLSRYPDTKNKDKALYYLAQSTKELNLPEQSQAYMDRLKKEYPKSIYAGATVRERKRLSVSKAAPRDKEALPALGYAETKKREIELSPPDEAVLEEMAAEDEQAAKDGDAKTRRRTSKGGDAPAGGVPPESPTAAADEKKSPMGFFSEKKPVDVVSDTMEGLEKGKVIVFRGHVIAKQVDLSMYADSLTAYLNEETNEIDRALAEGNVKIVKQERTATCEEAFFDNAKGEIVLKRNVVVFSGADKVSGETITYYINEDRVVVQGEKEKRARATVTPK